MGERKRRRAAAAPIKVPIVMPSDENGSGEPLVIDPELPISDGGPDITATDIYPTLDALWLSFVEHPGLGMGDASRQRREQSQFLVYTTAAEILRLIAFRMNADQDMRVFDEIGHELMAYDKKLQAIAKDYAAALN